MVGSSGNDKDNRITISKMAGIHNISRQTLIFYDKIGLFRPEIVDENGYRYYSYTQIPFLREICFLKSIGVKLEDIKNHIEHRNNTTAIDLLERQSVEIDKEIEHLNRIKRNIRQRINIYQNAVGYESQLYQPSVHFLPERKVIFFPWEEQDKSAISRQVLHTTLMKAWRLAEMHGFMLSSGWGSIIKKESLDTHQPLAGAGGYANVSSDDYPVTETIKELVVFPAGEYVCMYKYGMPYDIPHVHILKSWIDEHGYEICGDVVDECFLDTTFYDDEVEVDFCQLQIPVRKIPSV